MRASPLMLALALALGTPAGAALGASSSPDAPARSETLNTYIVVFDEPAAARFRGFGKSDVRRPQLAATSPVATGAARYDARSLEAIAYVEYLDQLRGSRLNDASQRLGRPLVPTHVFSHAMNGMAVKLTAREANIVAGLDGVRSVAPEFKRYLQTDRGPQWIKADLLWNGTATGTQRRGEGVIVGVIDSGIYRTHSAFSGAGITNPLGNGVYRGYCVANPAACNNKLIGLWDFTTGNGSNVDPVDNEGHGTHVASTAAGNVFGIYSGVAPRANIIAYKACPDLECDGAPLVAAINQAVADGVDVINYSIGSGTTDPWFSVGGAINDDSEAFLAAREAGIVVAAAAGNDGPRPGTLSTPANSPWVMGVAAATHNRGGAGDRLASFSARGPVLPLGVVKPDVTAPGVNIVAATPGGSTSVQTLNGTSMATPHVAGAAALLISDVPTRTPSQVISALTLTARNSVTDASQPTSPHLQGAGMVDVSLAARAGLFLEVPAGGFNAATANPFNGGAQNINLPSLGHGACFRTCTLTRTFKRMPGAGLSSYSIQSSLSGGATLTPSVTAFTSSDAGQSVTFTVNVDSPTLAGKWVYGTVTLVNTSGDGRPDLKLPVAVFATPFASSLAQAALETVSRTVTGERGFFDLDVANLVALPSARFATTPLVAATSTTQNIALDPTPNNPYDNVASNFRRLLTVPATPGGSAPVNTRIRVTTRAPNPDIDLFVGRDSNGNGLPDVGEEICRSTSPGSDEVCEFNLQSEAAAFSLWVMVQNYAGAGSNVVVDSFVVPLVPGGNGTLVATGPGSVTASLPFKLRIAHDDPSLVAGAERIGFVLVQPTAGSTAFEIPVRLTRTGATFEPFALTNAAPRAVTLPAGTSHDRLYFDVPPHATSVQFTTTASTGNVDLYVARLATPTAPGIEAAPAWNNVAAFRAATASGNETVTLTGANLQPGRHYVVPGNPTGGTVSANVTATVTAQGARPAFLSGQYANAARDGHGIFVDFAGPAGNPDQWVTVWYTYLEDTTPTWYYSQGASPGPNGIWKAELFRVVWDGGGTHAVDVGDVIITPNGTETMTLSYNLDGQSGFEPMQRIGGGNCPQFNGQALDVTGHWFSPSLAGFGYTYQATGGANPQEVFIPYIYDGAGVPRWLYGQKNFAASPNSVNLQWFAGFPPLAPRADLVGTAAGSATRTLATNNVTNMSVNTTFTGALSGTWVQNRAVSMLSQRKNCQ